MHTQKEFTDNIYFKINATLQMTCNNRYILSYGAVYNIRHVLCSSKNNKPRHSIQDHNSVIELKNEKELL